MITDAGALTPLTVEEINDLCEHLNASEQYKMMENWPCNGAHTAAIWRL